MCIVATRIVRIKTFISMALQNFFLSWNHRATTMSTKSYQHGIQCTMFQQKNVQNSLSSYFSDVFGFRDNNALTTLGVGDGRWDVSHSFWHKAFNWGYSPEHYLGHEFLLTPGFLSGLDFFSDKLIFGGVTCSSTSKGVAIWQLFWGPADSALAKISPWPSLDVQDVIHLHSMFFESKQGIPPPPPGNSLNSLLTTHPLIIDTLRFSIIIPPGKTSCC